ncbi:hypothetical protein [Rugosimonospora africana]|nr:hypothetical protein [Rugosimonospora africana]
MSEMWPEVADNLESFEGFSSGLNASRGTSRTRAVLWVAPTFIAIGREKLGIGHRVVVDRFAVSEIVSVTGQQGPAGGLDETLIRSNVPRPRDRPTSTGGATSPGGAGGTGGATSAGGAGGATSAGGAGGRLVIKTRRGDIDFTADAGDRGSTRSAYAAIADLIRRR